MEITPFELSLCVEGYVKRKEREAEEYQEKLKNLRTLMTIQAYQISRWVWAKNLDIKKILNEIDDKPKKNMTDEEMLAQVKALNALFGGEVKEIGTEK
jgi:predicted RNase H-like nuclease (RuvC/YqgF family)